MSDTPLEKHLPRGRGSAKFTALGLALRALKRLPAPMRERVLERAVDGVSSDLPPFADTLRLVEVAGGVPNGTLWKERLLEGRPDLRAVRTRDITDDRHGRVRARLYLPPVSTTKPTAALVWVHGGAFILGGLDQEEAHWPAIELAASGIPVLSVDYRQALHGVHYPAPQDDVLAAWQWATEHLDQLGVSIDQLHLGGASAGGCLAAGAALRIRESDRPMPASLYLAYPVLQGVLPPTDAATEEVLRAPGLTSDDWVAGMFDNWAGTASWDDPFVAPGTADAQLFPPTYVASCGVDTLRRASEPFARRLADAGVTVWHDLLPTSRHAPLDRPGTDDGKHALARLRTWLTSGISKMDD